MSIVNLVRNCKVISKLIKKAYNYLTIFQIIPAGQATNSPVNIFITLRDLKKIRKWEKIRT